MKIEVLKKLINRKYITDTSVLAYYSDLANADELENLTIDDLKNKKLCTFVDVPSEDELLPKNDDSDDSVNGADGSGTPSDDGVDTITPTTPTVPTDKDAAPVPVDDPSIKPAAATPKAAPKAKSSKK